MYDQPTITTFKFQTAGMIVVGSKSVFTLPEQLKMFGNVHSVLLLTDTIMMELGVISEIEKQFNDQGITMSVITGVRQEPSIQNIKEIFAEIGKESFDVIIGLGGGSILDTTKFLSVLMTNSIPFEELMGTEIKKPGIPMVLIPTTSGTGSEVTPNAIVTLPEEELKVGIVSRYFLPQLVILDPVLTKTLPKSMTAATGMDAFTHAFESYISNKANPMSDMFALESIREISQSIETAYNDGLNLKAREKMLLGSMYGGMALTGSGTAAVHALAYPLGGKFNIPHGIANAMLLPHVTEFNLDAISGRLSKVAQAMGLIANSNLEDVNVADLVISTINRWTEELHIPQNLSVYGVSQSDIPTLSVAASKVTRLLNNNPKSMGIKEIEMIYSKLF